MNEYDDLDAPVNPGEGMGFVSRGHARPVGTPGGADLTQSDNPVVRDTFAPEIARQEREQYRQGVQVERANREAQRLAAKEAEAQRKRQLSNTEAELRAKGAKFFTDAEGNIRPQTDEQGRTLYNETEWRKAGDPERGYWQEKRDTYGKTLRRKPKLKPGADETDPNLYYDFGDEGQEVAGHVDDLAKVKDPEVSAVVAKVQAQRKAEVRKASIMPLKQARELADSEYDIAQRDLIGLNDQASALQAKIGEIEANPEFGQKAGGVFGIGASPTEGASRLIKQRDSLAAQLAKIQESQSAATLRADKDGELARKAKAAKLDEDIWRAQADTAAYDDLAEARRAALKRDGKPEDSDPVLGAIMRKQQELGANRSRSAQERERLRGISDAAEAEARNAKPPGVDAVKAEAAKFETDAKAFDEASANGAFDAARRDDLVRRQGTLRGQVARIQAEAVQGMKDFEGYADGLVKDIENYQANSERWDYGKDFVAGSIGRQADRFDKAGNALKGKGTWTEGFGNTFSAFGGLVFGTWADIATGVSSDGVERKRRAEQAAELVGTFKGQDARRALASRVAAEEALKKDPAAQLVAVPSLKEKPLTEKERLRLSTGVVDLPTMQRVANALRDGEGDAANSIGIGTRETLRSLFSLVNVVPGVSLEKMGAPTNPEDFAKWKVLRGEVAKLMSEKHGLAEGAGMVAGSLSQFMLTRKAASAVTAKVADAAGKASLGARLAAVAANAERNADWLTYGTVGTASSFTENPESLGFFNRFMSAGMDTLGLAAGEIVGNKLEAVAGSIAKVKRGVGNLAVREAAGATGATLGEFSSDAIESAVLNQDFAPQVETAFWGNLGAVVGMRLLGARGRVGNQLKFNKFAETAAVAKNEAFNRWADVKGFMATPEGKRVMDLMPGELLEGGDKLARTAFASDVEGREAETEDAFKALTKDFGLTLGMGQFIQGVQARMSRSRVALREIDTLPDYEQMDPATGAPVVNPALRGVNRDAARALVRVANGVPVTDLTESESQAVQVIGAELGTDVFRDVGGVPVITDKASAWLGDRSPAAASLIGASEAEMISRAKAPEPTQEAAGGAGSAPNIDSGREAGGSPAPSQAKQEAATGAGVVEFTDSKGAARAVDVPAGAVVPSTGEAVKDAASARRWLAETAGETVRAVNYRGAQAAPAKEAAPAASSGALDAAQTKRVLEMAVQNNPQITAEQREPLARAVVAVRKRLADATARYGSVFPGGVRVVEQGLGSGGVFYDRASKSLNVSLGDVARDLGSLAGSPERIESLVMEEVIHRAAVEIEDAGGWSAPKLWAGLAPATQKAIREVYDPAGALKPTDWQLGHELVRLMVQGRLNLRGKGGMTLDGKLVSEATVSPSFVEQMREALAAIGQYLRDLAGRLRADGNAPETVVAVERAVSLVEARVNELSGAQSGEGAADNNPRRSERGESAPVTAVPSGQSRPATNTDETQKENVPQGRQEKELLTQAAPDLPAEGETLGGAQAGETGPRVPLVVGADGRLDAQGVAALARELGVKPEQVGLVEPVTNNGETFWTANVLLEADAANTSHLPDGRINPDYPQALQPRDRSGGQYLAQQRRIAARPNLREEALTGTADHGTPIMALVDGKPVTIMGNGRANAKALMYADADFKDAAAAFERGAQVLARRKGIEPGAVADLDKPVFARVILTAMTPDVLRTVSQDSNRPAGAATNAVEQGRIDSARLDANTLALFKPGFRIESRENEDFRAAFVRSVLRSGDENTTGADLVRRIENAIFLRAFGGTAEGAAAFERMTGEQTDAGVRNLVDSMTELAPEVSVARAKMIEGMLHPLDISQAIAGAVQRIGVALRDKPRNQSVDVALDSLVSQGSLLGDDAVSDDVLAFFVENRRDKARLLAGVRNFYALAYAAGNPKQGALFDEPAPEVGALWREAVAVESDGVLDAVGGAISDRLLSASAGGPVRGPVNTRYDNEEYPYLGDATEDWRKSEHPEARIVNPINPDIDADAKVDALRALTRENVPVVQKILADLAQVGLEGKYSEKLPERIQAKASRPSIRDEKPWHGIEHVRDALRFKVGLVHFNKLPQIVSVLRRNGVEIVKFDHRKMFAPKSWGWRFVAWDMRMPNGQLVEFYAPVPEMDNKTVKGPNHEIFEKWRNLSDAAIFGDSSTREAWMADVETSNARYGAAFEAATARMGYSDLDAALAAWNRAVALAEGASRANFSMPSTAEMPPGFQEPSADIRMAKSDEMTAASPFSDSNAMNGEGFEVEGAGDSDGFIGNTHTEKPTTQQPENGENRDGKLLAGRGQKGDGSGDFFDMLGVGSQADALARSLPPATRANPNAVKLAAKKAVPALKKEGLDAMAVRAGKIDGELELWGNLPPAPVEDGKNRLSDESPARKGDVDESRQPAPGTLDAQRGNAGEVGTRPVVGDGVGALPLFEPGDAAGVAGQGAAQPAANARGEGDGTVPAVGGNADAGAGGTGGSVSEALSDDGFGGAASLGRERAASRRVLRRAEYLKLPAELQNYRIAGDDIAPRGQRAKLRGNLDALRLLRTLETENRAATPEEKDTLARFVGWGGLPQVFDDAKGAKATDSELDYMADELAEAERNAKAYSHVPYYATRAESIRTEFTALTNWKSQYGEAYRDLKQLLTPEEWERAMRSTLNAHYTSPTVIRAMWSALGRMGFKGGRVLEPAGGVGHFFGAMPEEIMQASELSGVELDSISGRIFAKLYPQARVDVTGFQDARIPNASQDLVISNVPFAKTGPADASLVGAPNFNLHNYFFAKALQKTKPGGIVTFITTHYTMDAAASQRAWLANHSEFIGAMRLPNDAFKGNASTDVVTDIIFLRKPDGTPPPFNAESWSDTREAGREKVGDVETPITINEYFVRHPEMVLGRNALTGSMYRDNEYTVEPTGDLSAQLAGAVQALPENIIERADETPSMPEPEAVYADRANKPGNFVERDGRLFYVDKLELKPIESLADFVPVVGDDNKAKSAKTRQAKALRRLRAWLPLRDHYKQHLALMLNTASTEAEIEASRARLNQLYDQVQAVDAGKYPLSSNAWNALRTDPDFFLTLGLEVPVRGEDGEPDSYRKADVFSRRTVVPPVSPTRAASSLEAVRISQAWKGRVDSLFVANLLGIEQDEAEKRMIDDGLAFRDPATGLLEDRDGYLSGYVREKLAAAKIAADTETAYAANVAALEKVQPAPVPLSDITVRLGVSWIPADVVSEFMQTDLRLAGEATVSRMGERVSWGVREASKSTRGSDANTRTWAAGGWNGLELMEAVLNARAIQSFKSEGEGKEKKRVVDPVATAQAQDMAEKMRRRFAEWVKTPGREIEIRVGEFSQKRPVREIVERGYNDALNGYVERRWDGAHLTLPGTAPHVLGDENKGGLRAHQKAAIWRAVTEGHAFLAHAPGFGKTNVFIAIAMEWRRLGVSKKPMIVVQNSTLEQFAASFRRMYPAANVLVASKDDLGKDNRKAFTARIAASDWDAVIVAHSQFALIPSDPVVEAAQIRILRDEMQEAMNARAAELSRDNVSAKEIERDPSVKDIAKQLEAIEKRLAAVAERKQDDVVNFGEMGIDSLLIDEAHYFKKVPFATQLERIAGLDRGASQRAFDTLVKARGIQDKRDGRGVVLGTGTPITNTMAEIWNMLRLSAPKLLKRFGVEAFDDFIKSFGSVERSVEMNAVGTFVERNRLKRFVNGGGLAQMVRAGMDVQMDASKVTLNRPKVDVEPVVVPRSAQVGEYIERLVNIYEKWAALDGRDKQEWSAVPVVLAGLGKAASLDYQLVDASAPDDPGSKVNQMIPLVARYYREQAGHKGTQLVFADSYRTVKTEYIDRFEGGGSATIEADDGTGDESSDEETTQKAPEVERTLYHKIKDKLVAAGIPADEIAVVTDYANGDAREALFAKVNAGEVRVLIGSTFKMGVGVNVQERLYAVHHLDAPWTPADLDQRNARSERDGNRYYDWNESIKRHSYAMADTLDAGRFQLLETKGKFSRQALEGKMGVEFEDPAGGIVDEAAQMKALAAGNPLVLKQVELSSRVRELDIGRQAWARTQNERETNVQVAKRELSDYTREYDVLAKNSDELHRLAEANPIAEPAKLVEEIDARIKAGGKAVSEDGAFALENRDGRDVFTRNLRGLLVTVKVRAVIGETNDGGEKKQSLTWRATASAGRDGDMVSAAAEVKSGGGKRVLQLIDDVLSDARRSAESMERAVEASRARLAAVEREVGGEWELMDEFIRSQRALAAVDKAIKENKKELPPEDAALLSAPGQIFFEFKPTTQVEPDRAGLVRDNVDLADQIARNWRVRGIERDDLKGEARLALVRAAKGYDPTKGGFRSYAGVSIRNALRDKYADAQSRTASVSSFEEPVGDGGLTRGDFIGEAESTRNTVARGETFRLLNETIDSLPERPRRIVRLYMQGRTLSQIGEVEGGVSGEAIRKTMGNIVKIIGQRLRREGVQGLEEGILFSQSANGGNEDEAEIARLLNDLAADVPADAMRDMQRRVDLEADGERTLGRPDLANPAKGSGRNIVNAVDAVRAADAERETQDAWRDEAQKLVARDRAGTLRDILERSRRGDVLSDPVQVKAAQILVADLTAEAVRTRNPQTMRDAQLLAYAYREQGTEQARAMAARHDPHKRPAERYKEFLAGSLFAPTPAIRKAMRNAWSPAEKARTLADLRRKLTEAEGRAARATSPGVAAKWQAEATKFKVEMGRAMQRRDQLETMNAALGERLAKIEAEIGKMGVTLDDVFNGEAYLRLRGAKIIGSVADKAGFSEAKRRALKFIQNGWNNAEVAKRTGLTAEQVAGVEAEMVTKLKERLRKLGDAALDVSKFDTEALFSGVGDANAEKGMSAAEREAKIEEIVRAMGFNRSAEREVRTRRARKSRPEGNRVHRGESPYNPASDATLDEIRRTRPTGAQGDFGDPNPLTPGTVEAPDTGGRPGELENPARQTEPGRVPVYPGTATGRADTTGGNRQLALGEDTDAAPPAFDITDAVQVSQLARVIQASDANGFDMAFEYWVNSVLSGPLTQGANIIGNTTNLLWDFGPKRFAEAAVNAAIGNRSDLPHMAEYAHLMRATAPALSRAWGNALRSWSGESTFFENDVLDEQLTLGLDDKAGGARAAIGGDLGRTVRIPGRLLMAADDFFKSAVGHLEATGQAYRIAKAEGLRGEALESRIAGLVNTPGSAAWSAAVEKAKELTFQSENEGTVVGAVTKSIARLRETDFGYGVRPLRFIVPFIRTPMNIFQQGLRQSPLGSIPLAVRLGMAGLYRIKDGRPVATSYPAAQLAKHIVEQAFAWTLAALVYAGAAGDDDDEKKTLLITGAVDGSTAGLRELNERIGRKPYSIRVGGVTVNYGRIEPLATALGATVDAITQWKRGKRSGDYSFVGAFLNGIAQQGEDKTFLRGIGDLMAAVADKRGEREGYVANFLASWVPNVIRQPIAKLDESVRDARGASFGEGLLGRVVPQTLPERVNVYGEEMKKPGLAAWRATIPIEVMRSPEVARVDKLLENWAQTHPGDAWAPAPITRHLSTGSDKERELSGAEKHDLAVESGKLAARLLAGVPLNVENPTADDIERVKKAFTMARATAKRRLLGK